jgi:hypothetical protein
VAADIEVATEANSKVVVKVGGDMVCGVVGEVGGVWCGCVGEGL